MCFFIKQIREISIILLKNSISNLYIINLDDEGQNVMKILSIAIILSYYELFPFSFSFFSSSSSFSSMTETSKKKFVD